MAWNEDVEIAAWSGHGLPTDELCVQNGSSCFCACKSITHRLVKTLYAIEQNRSMHHCHSDQQYDLAVCLEKVVVESEELTKLIQHTFLNSLTLEQGTSNAERTKSNLDLNAMKKEIRKRRVV
eukprot:4799430-Amphidinium_carterae.1